MISGVQSRQYNGLVPTNKKLVVEGISLQQIAGGKIMDTCSVWDTLGLSRKARRVGTVAEVEVAGKVWGN